MRRALGRYVLVTNGDVLIGEALIKALADRQLDDESFYRIDRHDLWERFHPSMSRGGDMTPACQTATKKVRPPCLNSDRAWPRAEACVFHTPRVEKEPSLTHANVRRRRPSSLPAHTHPTAARPPSRPVSADHPCVLSTLSGPEKVNSHP